MAATLWTQDRNLVESLSDWGRRFEPLLVLPRPWVTRFSPGRPRGHRIRGSEGLDRPLSLDRGGTRSAASRTSISRTAPGSGGRAPSAAARRCTPLEKTWQPGGHVLEGSRSRPGAPPRASASHEALRLRVVVRSPRRPLEPRAVLLEPRSWLAATSNRDVIEGDEQPSAVAPPPRTESRREDLGSWSRHASPSPFLLPGRGRYTRPVLEHALDQRALRGEERLELSDDWYMSTQPRCLTMSCHAASWPPGHRRVERLLSAGRSPVAPRGRAS